MEKTNARQDNYERAREQMKKHIGAELTQDSIKSIYALIMGISTPSEYRTEGASVAYQKGKPIYNAPNNETLAIQTEVQKLLDWYNKNKSNLPVIEVAAIFHWVFVRIHPFADGNGRIARILVSLILLNGGYSNATCRHLESHFEIDNGKAYYEALSATFMYCKFDEEIKGSQKWLDYFSEAISRLNP